ncbi:MAG: TnsA endonuclease N-terminal domain-containing protein [Solobacterium sp.]|nr:TnsA endonuclease N-terminal domain-containing protein [Solobacterium sp.]
MRYKTDEKKYAEKRGTGEGANYKPWIQTGEFGSLGTTATPIDWITGRQVHLESQPEHLAWYILRFNPYVIDVREQVPLQLDITLELADQLHIQHPLDSKTHKPVTISTDLLVTTNSGDLMAYSVKASLPGPKEDGAKRLYEKLRLEHEYWKRQHIKFFIINGETINRTYAHNIRLVTAFYNLPENALDDISYVKHLIARRLIKVDLESEELDFRELAIRYKREVDLCRQYHMESVM